MSWILPLEKQPDLLIVITCVRCAIALHEEVGFRLFAHEEKYGHLFIKQMETYGRVPRGSVAPGTPARSTVSSQAPFAPVPAK